MRAQLKLQREGRFYVEEAQDTRTQCGREGTTRFNYRVEVLCHDTALDENGFIVDQFEIHNLLNTRYKKLNRLPSCEELALDAAKAIAGMCKDLIGVRVFISPMKGAGMTATLDFRKRG